MKILFAILLFVSSSFASEWIYSNDDMSYHSRIEVITFKRSKARVVGAWIKGWWKPDENTMIYFNCKERTSGYYDYLLDPIDPDSKVYTLMLNICEYERGATTVK